MRIVETVFIDIELLTLIGLLIMAFKEPKYNMSRFRFLYLFPAFIALCFVMCAGFDADYIPYYIGGFIGIVALYNIRLIYKKMLIACSLLLVLISTVIGIVSPNHNRPMIYDDFKEGFATMKAHYILDKEKGINWDELYDEYEPEFKAADKNRDVVRSYQLWQAFCNEFYDGHVSYTVDKPDIMLKSFGADYGFSLVRLDDGRFVAINVEGYEHSFSIDEIENDRLEYERVKKDYIPDNLDDIRLTLKNAGIKNGTVITKIDGKDITDYYDYLDYYMYQYPDRNNEEFYKPFYVAGLTEDGDGGYSLNLDTDQKDSSIEITYIDDNNQERTVSAPYLGAYAARLIDTFVRLDEGEFVSNLDWKSINDDTVLLRISGMIYDYKTYEGVDFDVVSNQIREDVLAYKEAGVKNIIIDLRANSGGSPYFVQAVAKIFAPKGEHLTYYSAKLNEKTATFERGEDGKYIKGEPSSYQGEDIWHDGKIILLVNAECVSAGDDMVYMMGDYPNVRVMGLTSSNSSCQAVTGIELSNGSLSFSAVPNLDENGEIVIDTRTDHVGRTPFDEKIPMTLDVVDSIFNRGEDYLVDYVVDRF